MLRINPCDDDPKVAKPSEAAAEKNAIEKANEVLTSVLNLSIVLFSSSL